VRDFWKGKRVLVTGHTGFKGSWLCLWLQRLGAEIVGYALEPPSQPNLFEIARVAEGMSSLTGDIRDLNHLTAAMRDYRPQIVIHMAAQALVRPSYQQPVETYSTNIMGTVNVLEAVRHVGGVKVIVIVTSDKCYENKEWVWGYRESEPMGGHDPYSSSKGCAELITSAYLRSFFSKSDYARHGVALASARAGNVIGGGDWAQDRLIPDVMRAFLASRPVRIRYPQAVRPWQHVLEPLAGYLTLCQKLWEGGPAYAEAWNFGPHDQDARPVAQIVDRLSELWGDEAVWEPNGNPQPHEAHHLRLDCSKAIACLGWRSRWGLEKALETTVDWYRAYQEDREMRDFTLSQIAAYER
jgi:CDP-glucose 4,6-dehydratase